MFEWIQKIGKSKSCKQLDEILQRIEMNIANNYKDAAQENLKEFESQLKKLRETQKINQKQLAEYEDKFCELQKRMKHFTHKDQKPFWV